MGEGVNDEELPKTLFWSKAWYFSSFASSGLLTPLLNLYFKRSGLSESQIGIIAAMKPWTSAIAGNAWATVADHTGAYKTILLIAHTSAVTTRYCIGLAGSFPLILILVVVTEAMTAPIQILADASTMAAGSEGNYGKARLWGAIGWGGASPVSGIIVSNFGEMASFNANLLGGILQFMPVLFMPTEALRLKQMQKTKGSSRDAPIDLESATRGPNGSGHTEKLGSITNGGSGNDAEGLRRGQRLESEGESLEPPCCSNEDDNESEPLLERSRRHSSATMKRGESFLYEVADTLPLAPAPEFVEYESALHHSHDNERTSMELGSAGPCPETDCSPEAVLVAESSHLTAWQKLGVLFSDPEILIFFALAVLFGFATGTIDGYLFLYLDVLGAPELLMGLTITVSCVIELPIFHYMGSILHFFGVQPMLHLVMLCFLIRLLCYSLLEYAPSPWLVLPVESLNAITFGCAWAAGTVQCSRSAPLGLEATTQSIYAGLYGGLGRGLGGLFGGFVYSRYGPQNTFLATCLVMAIGWLICSLAQLSLYLWRRSRESDLRRPLLQTN